MTGYLVYNDVRIKRYMDSRDAGVIKYAVFPVLTSEAWSEINKGNVGDWDEKIQSRSLGSIR